MGHRKLGRFNQALHRGLRQRKFNFALPVVKIREIGGRQRRQREAATARTHQHPIAFQLNGNLRALRQAAADIKEFPRRHGSGAWLMRLRKRNARDHLHFKIGAGQRKRTVRYLEEQVTENRQRRTAAQRAADLLKRF